MKFTATKEKLLEGLQQVQNVVSTRTTLPILSNVLLQAQEGGVSLTTTDLDVGVRGKFEANVEKAGATTLPARRLFTIIRELPSSEISIEVDGKNAAFIRSGQSFFKILGLPEEEFPPLPKFENAKVVTLRQKDLHDRLYPAWQPPPPEAPPMPLEWDGAPINCASCALPPNFCVCR